MTFSDQPRFSPVYAKVLSAMALCIGCSADRDSGAVVAARDSAGLSIIEVDARAHTPIWSIGREPIARIGAADGSVDATLYRVLAARRLSNGSVAVLNGGTQELRLYNTAGDLLASVGGRGDGPGEFRRLARFLQRVQGDTIVLFDAASRRVSYVGPTGQVVALITLRPNQQVTGTVSYAGRLPNGNHLVTSSNPVTSPTGQTPGPDTLALLLFSADGNYISEVARFASGGSVAVDQGGGRMQRLPAPFAAEAIAVATEDGIVVGRTGRFEFRRYSSDGVLNTIRRHHDEPLTLSAHHRAAYPTEQFPGVVLPETVPFFERMLVGTAGRIWIARHSDRTSDQPQTWDIFRIDSGSVLGRLELPAEFTLEDVGDDYVLVSRRDELDVEYIEIYELRSR